MCEIEHAAAFFFSRKGKKNFSLMLKTQVFFFKKNFFNSLVTN